MVKENAEQTIKRLQRENSKIFNKYLQPATDRHIGLMSPTDKQALSHSLGQREWVDQEISILDLQPGRYAGFAHTLTDGPYQTTNKDDATVLEVDVFADVEPRKQIIVHYSGLGTLYYRNVHSNSNNNPQDWQAIQKEVELWSGNAKDNNTEIVLSDSLRHYTRVKVAFNTVSYNIYNEYQIPGEGKDISLRDINLSDGTANFVSAYETRLRRTSDTSMTIAGSTNKSVGATGTITDASEKITITKIIGIR